MHLGVIRNMCVNEFFHFFFCMCTCTTFSSVDFWSTLKWCIRIINSFIYNLRIRKFLSRRINNVVLRKLLLNVFSLISNGYNVHVHKTFSEMEILHRSPFAAIQSPCLPAELSKINCAPSSIAGKFLFHFTLRVYSAIMRRTYLAQKKGKKY